VGGNPACRAETVANLVVGGSPWKGRGLTAGVETHLKVDVDRGAFEAHTVPDRVLGNCPDPEILGNGPEKACEGGGGLPKPS
jgi:hypothetical protein